MRRGVRSIRFATRFVAEETEWRDKGRMHGAFLRECRVSDLKFGNRGAVGMLLKCGHRTDSLSSIIIRTNHPEAEAVMDGAPLGQGGISAYPRFSDAPGEAAELGRGALHFPTHKSGNWGWTFRSALAF